MGENIAQYRLTRLNSDGSVDTSFVSAGSGFNNSADALAWDSTNQKLYVGGQFTTYTKGSSTTQNRIARLNSDGTVDTTFVPAGAGFNGRVRALAWDSAHSKLYVGGSFTSYTNGSTTTQNRITRLNSDGTVDTTFVPAGAGFNSDVYALAWDSTNQKLYVGGNFTSYTNGSSITQNYLSKLNSDGSVDTSFVPSGGGFDSWVNSLAWNSSSERLYAGGAFTQYTNGTAVSQSLLTSLKADGTVDTNFIEAGGGIKNSTSNNVVNSVYWDSNQQKLYCGGTFNSFNSAIATNVVRISSDGSLDL
jgi:uncharacterized delta-60 repeat protein